MIGKYLKQQREYAQMSQGELAKQTGLKQANISRWENDIQTPQIDATITLAKFYGCTLDELVGLTDEQNYNGKSSLPTQLPPKTVAFTKNFGEMFSDKNYIEMSKLYKAITPELRALTLGYIVGLLQNNGVNTKTILGY